MVARLPRRPALPTTGMRTSSNTNRVQTTSAASTQGQVVGLGPRSTSKPSSVTLILLQASRPWEGILSTDPWHCVSPSCWQKAALLETEAAIRWRPRYIPRSLLYSGGLGEIYIFIIIYGHGVCSLSFIAKRNIAISIEYFILKCNIKWNFISFCIFSLSVKYPIKMWQVGLTLGWSSEKNCL